jgi:putative endonuclease
MAASPRTGTLALGRHAEGLAAEHLQGLGYTILARNWRRPEGELDLIVGRDSLCVFVEVRSRTGDERGHPLETVDARKQARVRRAALLYMDAEHPQATSFRFDVIGVTFAPDGGPPELIHVENAFQAG